ncbi:hypothetical protein ES703_71656 [subsurface metagenome]
MANQTEVLRALLTKEGAASPADLAGELRAGEATIRTYLNRLKKKGRVDGGGSAWYITDAGKAALDREEEIPTTKEDVGEDELSKFRYYGELSGISTDMIDACAELFQNTDMRSMDEMERVMAEMNIPQPQRIRWRNLYRGYLRNTTPRGERDELYPLPKAEEAAAEEGAPAAGEPGKGDRLDYIVEGNDILQVGEGLGMFTFRQALQVVAAKRGTAPPSQTSGLGTFKDFADAVSTLNPNKPITLEDVVTLANMVNESRGGGNVQAPPGSFVDGEGEVHELKPGQPIVIKKVVREPGKTYLLNPDGELEEHEPGKPIIIKLQPPGSGSNPPGMMPFPVFGSDGQPAYDKDGKPIYANLEPMMKYMGFQSEQRRAEERHNTLMGLAKTVRENFGDGIAALKATAEGIKGGPGAKAPESKQEQPQVFECADCKTQFSPPPGWAGQNIKCPGCQREYTKEELMA